MRRASLILALTAAFGTMSLAGAPAAHAGSAWDEIRAGVFAGRTINPAGEAVVLTAPFRPLDQRAVPIEVEARFADGRTVRAVTIIVDQNPTPVAARFDIGGKREHLKVSTLLRLNAGTDVRAIVEASDGLAGGIDGAAGKHPGADLVPSRSGVCRWCAGEAHRAESGG